MPNGHPIAFMEMAHQKMITSNPTSSNPTRVTTVVHPASFLARRNACVDFVSDVKCSQIKKLVKIDTIWHAQGLSKKHLSLLDTHLPKGCFWTPPTDRHDTAMTGNDAHVFLISQKKTQDPLWPTRHGNDSNDTTWHISGSKRGEIKEKCRYY